MILVFVPLACFGEAHLPVAERLVETMVLEVLVEEAAVPGLQHFKTLLPEESVR